MNRLKRPLRVLNEFPKSEIFWTTLMLIGMIFLGIYIMEALWVLWGIGSLLVLASMSDGIDDAPILWFFLMPITWICITVVAVGSGLGWIYIHTIRRFNDYLNNL